MKTLDSSTQASSPGSLSLSNEKLKELRPELYGLKGKWLEYREKKSAGYSQIEQIREHIFYGDSQPAVVLSVDPLIIVAYSEDLDCVVPLYFSNIYVKKYRLKEKTRLITVNTYMRGPKLQEDIILGPNNSGVWFGFHPIIAEFVSDDLDVIEMRKLKIDEKMWEYVYKLGGEYSSKYPNAYRDGRPIYSQNPATIRWF
ncbi:hypothetical protein CSC2_05670 [Clostridium zeae]|uniref:Uncharacterized protein n=1 Tax=Clostridium zeae TaxID=2759022 RepID=A0ABQ1E5M4_9CLOT|nr:hypothetical protein [Clostridium zeae]GFZ30041.1 hypothetical protein CSC2_05670 [Clostridium zeae]